MDAKTNSILDAAALLAVLIIGAALTVGSQSDAQLAAGVVLLVVALLGPGATRLSIRAASAELTLDRRLGIRSCRHSDDASGAEEAGARTPADSR